MEHFLPIITCILGAVGFIIAFHIYHKKKYSVPLVCPIGSDCNAVVHSDYAEFFGIPVERLGMAYYAFTVLYALVASSVPSFSTSTMHFVAMGVTFGAFLFSVYLISIQAFVLREWCTWCLGSAFISTLLFLVSFLSTDFSTIIPFMTAFKTPIVLVHGIAAAVGLGSAVVTDLFFLRFLRDGKISLDESALMKLLSRIIWAALGLLVITGFALYLPQKDILHQSPKFLVKMIGVAVLIVNGVCLNHIIAPVLTKIDFASDAHLLPPNIRYMRRWAFAFGAISMSSWLTIFILGSLRSVSVDFGTLLAIYALVLFIAVSISQISVGHVTKISSV